MTNHAIGRHVLDGPAVASEIAIDHHILKLAIGDIGTGVVEWLAHGDIVPQPRFVSMGFVVVSHLS